MAEARTEAQVQKIRQMLAKMGLFLTNYEWLINSYTTDYFSLGMEHRFPASFSKALLDECSLSSLASFLPSWTGDTSVEKCCPTLLPLSMLAFRQLCTTLSLSQSSTLVGSPQTAIFGSNLEKYFRVCVKPKKKHEVDRLSELISSLCRQTGCSHVVDVGAGLGHLSRLLTYNKGLKVTTIEAADTHSPKSQRLDKKTAGLLTKDKINNADELDRPNHISHWISSDITTDEFIKIINENRNQQPDSATSIINDLSNKMDGMLAEIRSSKISDMNRGMKCVDLTLPWFDLPWNSGALGVAAKHNTLHASTNENLLLTSLGVRSKYINASRNTLSTTVPIKRDKICLSGLHACGDLSTTLLRVFVNLDCAKILSSVACCYMKLSHSQQISEPEAGNLGFPMSDYVRNLPSHAVLSSYAALEMGCHFVAQYRKRLLNEEGSLRRHAVRAALQTLLYRRKEKSQIQFKRLKIKNSETLPFKTYAEQAFTKLGLQFDVTDDEVKECEKAIETHWRAVVGTYTLRLALSPIVEAYILLDRMLYLYENGIPSVLVPVFDPDLSPRNMALIAYKDCSISLPCSI